MRSLLLFLFIGIAPGIFGQVDTAVFETGIASYYANAFEGRKCSNGDVFKQDSLTAAHKTLKFGTKVKVINLKNDSTVVVRINDRLPKNSKRCIDLSKKAAKKLNFVPQGLTKVKIQLVIDTLLVMDSLRAIRKQE